MLTKTWQKYAAKDESLSLPEKRKLEYIANLFVHSATMTAVVCSAASAQANGRKLNLIGTLAGYTPPVIPCSEQLIESLLIDETADFLISLQSFKAKHKFACALWRSGVIQAEGAPERAHVDWPALSSVWAWTCVAGLPVTESLPGFSEAEPVQRRLQAVRRLLIDAKDGGAPCVTSENRLFIPGLLERRNCIRIARRMPVNLHIADSCIAVTLENVSVGGAGLSGSPYVPPNTMVQIGLPDMRVLDANVVWSRNERLGVQWIAALRHQDPLLTAV